jgi:predicted glycosyltransferase
MPYQLRVPQNKVHSLLYYATMFVGDSQTMTSEAAVLGTPSIRCNTFVGRIHYLEEEEHRYHLTYGFRPENSEAMFSRVNELLAMGTATLKAEWAKRRAVLLSEKIDYTAFLTYFIENYPQSVDETRHADAEFWKRFK